MKLFTIGFTQRSAAEFFGLLREMKISRLIDIRLNNVSQLAGFAKREDLQFFLKELCGVDYRHELRFAPEEEMFKRYRAKKCDWDEFATGYLELLRERKVEALPRDVIVDRSVLLCSERSATHCHRRLAAAYLAEQWGKVEIEHL